MKVETLTVKELLVLATALANYLQEPREFDSTAIGLFRKINLLLDELKHADSSFKPEFKLLRTEPD